MNRGDLALMQAVQGTRSRNLPWLPELQLRFISQLYDGTTSPLYRVLTCAVRHKTDTMRTPVFDGVLYAPKLSTFVRKHIVCFL